jgi:hypothetical protein
MSMVRFEIGQTACFDSTEEKEENKGKEKEKIKNI